MRKVLMSFEKETLVEFIIQRMGLRRTKEVERDILFIAWERQEEKAIKATTAACELIKKAKGAKQHLAAQVAFENGMASHKKADRMWAQLDAMRSK